jgi:hypothetical protein
MRKRHAIWTIASFTILFASYFAYCFAIGAWLSIVPYFEKKEEIEVEQKQAEDKGLVWGGRMEYEWPHEVKVMGPPISVVSATGDLKLLGKQVIAVSSMRVPLADDTAGPVILELGDGQTITFCNVREQIKKMLGLPEKHVLEDPSFYTFSPQRSYAIGPAETQRVEGREASYAVMFAVTENGLEPVSAVYTGRHPSNHCAIWIEEDKAIVIAVGTRDAATWEFDHAGIVTPQTKQWDVQWKCPGIQKGYQPPYIPENAFWLSPDKRTIAGYDYESKEDDHPVLKAVSLETMSEVNIAADSIDELIGYEPLTVSPKVYPSHDSFYLWRSADNAVVFAKVDSQTPGYAAEVIVEVPWSSALLFVLALPWDPEDDIISYCNAGRGGRY